jgi:hypothetical protein
VIPFPKTNPHEGEGLWRFFDFGENGKSVIEPWHEGLTEAGQDTLSTLLKHNRKTGLPIHWIGIKFLQGKQKEEGIWELRFFDDRQQRLLGIFGSQRRQAIFLIGCSHKGKVYVPSECLETAVKRAKSARQGAQLYERAVEENL